MSVQFSYVALYAPSALYGVVATRVVSRHGAVDRDAISPRRRRIKYLLTAAGVIFDLRPVSH